jgi:hypothetical protein
MAFGFQKCFRGGASGFACVFIAVLASLAPAEILDRVAVTVGDRVITQQQIVHEIRVAAFLNRETPNISAASKRTAADHLVKQDLIRSEMQSTHYPLPDKSESGPLETQVIDQYAGEAKYLAALEASGLTRDDILEQLWWQLTTLRFIDYRFKPAVHIPQADISSYYQAQVEKWKAQGQKDIPTLEQSRDSIEEILTDERVDQALDSWMAEARKRVNVRYVEDAFQ